MKLAKFILRGSYLLVRGGPRSSHCRCGIVAEDEDAEEVMRDSGWLPGFANYEGVNNAFDLLFQTEYLV